MLLEQKLGAWLLAGIDLYKQHPLMIEAIFFDQSQVGWPVFTGPSTFVDSEKLWIPNEYAGGVLRWGGQDFPILGNTAQAVTVQGDAEAVDNVEGLPYQIIPVAVAGLTEFLMTTDKFTVSTAFNQVPTSMPCFTLRLEKDDQSDTYIGENLEQYAVDGVEFDVRSQGITAAYLITIWTNNPDATLWLYSWLLNWGLNSLPVFTTWGLYNVAFSGSDIDPTLQYLAERTYTRHLLFTCTRIERAVTTREVEWVSSFCVKVLAHYAQLRTLVSAME